MTDKDTDIEISTIPNDKYKKFFDKFAEIETLDVAQWKVANLLGYFCKKYKETYNLDYAWKFNNPSPAKCFEVWQFNTLCAKLSANPKILRDYIDWVYITHVPKTKARFRSISFITKDEVVNDYKLNVLLAGQKNLHVDRSTPLPAPYQAILKETANLSIGTYGDLSFISQMDPMPDNITQALQKMASQGFDKDVLKRIV
ncbi:MAG TPA: hypothetical protein VII94_03930 [Candidatus Saccharimonadales bacterium]